jgi:hypothetical protein
MPLHRINLMNFRKWFRSSIGRPKSMFPTPIPAATTARSVSAHQDACLLAAEVRGHAPRWRLLCACYLAGIDGWPCYFRADQEDLSASFMSETDGAAWAGTAQRLAGVEGSSGSG